MIDIKDKSKCCGCEACSQICPKSCISMIPDEEGFLYPFVDVKECINCGLCKKTCPVNNPTTLSSPKIEVFAAKNPSLTIRQSSSSGGFFSCVAENIVNDEGCVCGAAFDDNYDVSHIIVDSLKDLSKLRGSKYVQSRIGTIYKEIKVLLEGGKLVLFSGTPCQVAGLYAYIKKTYENLLTIEVFCHGVPSPLVWKDYVTELSNNAKENQIITDICFRDKQKGWKNYSFSVSYKSKISDYEEKYTKREKRTENKYLRAFLNNLIVRPICFSCPFKNGVSGADISLGDFWSIDRYCHSFNDDKGVSLVYINSERGLESVQKLKVDKVVLKRNIDYNTAFSKSTKEKYNHSLFWNEYQKQHLACLESICSEIEKKETNFYIELKGIVKKIILEIYNRL